MQLDNLDREIKAGQTVIVAVGHDVAHICVAKVVGVGTKFVTVQSLAPTITGQHPTIVVEPRQLIVADQGLLDKLMLMKLTY